MNDPGKCDPIGKRFEKSIMAEVSACPDLQQLLRLVLGKASSEEVERLGQHLLACRSCVDTLHDLQAVDTLTRQLQTQANAAARPVKDLIDSVIHRLGESPTGPKGQTLPQMTPAFPATQSFAGAEMASAASPGTVEQGETGLIGGYRVLKILGSGGMGFVLQAEDVGLQRLVALKIMKPEVAKDPASRQRFLREARAAAALKHDNVVTIYQVGQENDVPFLAMEFLEGESLDDRLERLGKLPVADALQIGREIAQGLAAAHARDLIHRDIKPANIWLEAGTGRVKILDFGLARPASENVGLTEVGMVVGTPEFMAPEQARGGALDHRCDLFSLGAVLYTACSGETPFQGSSAIAVMMAVTLDAPTPLRERNPEVPPALAELIERLLAKDPANRPASAGEIADALAAVESGVPNDGHGAKSEGRSKQATVASRPPSLLSASSPVASRASLLVPPVRRLVLGIAAGLVALALAAGIFLRLTRPMAPPVSGMTTGDSPPVIAVLPFINSAGDRETAYLCDGIPGSLLKRLSEIKQLSVRPYHAGPKKQDQELSLTEIGRQLDAQTVLTGRVQQSGDRLFIQIQLVDVRENRLVWVEQYERQPADLQDIETDIAQQVCVRLGVSLSREEAKRLARHDTTDPEAYRLYLQGRHYLSQSTLEGMNKALTFFKQAIARDPKYALAHAGLADAYGYYAGDWMPYEEALPEQKKAARKAVELDDELAETHLAMGNVYMGQDYNWPAAEKEFKRAIELKPRLDLAHDAYAQFLAFQGRFDESITQQKEALEINPSSPSLLVNLSYMYYLQRRYDQALEQARKALKSDANFVVAHDYLGAAYLQKGQGAEALAEFRKCRQLDDVPWYLARLAAAEAVAGNPDEARGLLKQLRDLSIRRYVTPECFFLVYVALGEKDQAFAWLQKMYEVRSQYPLRLKVQPDFDSLRGDPRFAEWLRRLNLTP